jgi:hypothetical protein
MDARGVCGGWGKLEMLGRIRRKKFLGEEKAFILLRVWGAERKTLLSVPNGETARCLPKWIVALVLLGLKLPGLPLPNRAFCEAHAGKLSIISPIAYLGIWHNTTLPGILALSVRMFSLGSLES